MVVKSSSFHNKDIHNNVTTNTRHQVSFVHRVTIWIYFLGRLEFKSSALLVNGKKIMSIGKFKLSLLKINLND